MRASLSLQICEPDWLALHCPLVGKLSWGPRQAGGSHDGDGTIDCIRCHAKGMTVDLEELLKKVRSGAIKELILSDVTLPDGTRIARAQLDTPADAAMFADLMDRSRQGSRVKLRLRGWPSGATRSVAPAKSITSHAPNALMLSKAMVDHLSDLAGPACIRRPCWKAVPCVCSLGSSANVPVASLTQDHVRAFFDGVRYWPSNATKRPTYRDLSVPEVIKLAKRNQEPEPALDDGQAPSARASFWCPWSTANIWQ